MKKIVLVAALLLAACGQATTAKAPDAEAAAPAALKDQVLAMPAENQPVFAFQQLVAYQHAHPDAVPPCTAVRASEARGIIPDNVAADSVYAQYKGAAVYSVQCGALISATQYDPREHWIVAFPDGAAEVSVANCADARGHDKCPRAIPPTAAATTTTPATP